MLDNNHSCTKQTSHSSRNSRILFVHYSMREIKDIYKEFIELILGDCDSDDYLLEHLTLLETVPSGNLR